MNWDPEQYLKATETYYWRRLGWGVHQSLNRVALHLRGKEGGEEFKTQKGEVTAELLELQFHKRFKYHSLLYCPGLGRVGKAETAQGLRKKKR